ncbi:MAG: hypothetical protein K0R61_4565 [Microvirga sp.]|nr:hypothetical protein [Microvirga sp.]
MYYEVTGQQPWGGRGVITISVETAQAALGIAHQWARQGVSVTSQSRPPRASPSISTASA